MPRRLLRLVSKRTPEPRQPGYAFSPEDVVWAMGSFCALNRKPLAADFNTAQTLSQAQFAGRYAGAAILLALAPLFTQIVIAIGLAIARALLKQPKILILDKATSSRDSSTSEHFATMVNQLKGKVTMLFITHAFQKNLMVVEVVRIGRSLCAVGGGHVEASQKIDSAALHVRLDEHSKSKMRREDAI